MNNYPTITSLIAASLLTTEVHANTETSSQPDFTLPEVLVEGELINRSQQEAATSVAVIPGDELDTSSDADVYDVVERTPNITSSFGEKGFAIRGIDQRGLGAGSGQCCR